ncbi:MAG: hypothetical protein ACKO9B_05820 [Planctomycetota bacterium]
MSGNDNPDALQFEVVLEELRQLVKEFDRIGVEVVLIAGKRWQQSSCSRAALV